MSLIEEALRRVKDPLVPPSSTKPKTTQKASPPPAAPAPHSWSATAASAPPQSANSPVSPLTLVTLAVLGLTAALLLGGAVWMWNSFGNRRSVTASPTTSEAVPEPSSDESPQAGSRQEPADAPRSAKVPAGSHPDFRLTGIVEGLGEPYAVINGSIVAEGETIGGATLLTIAEGTVTLRLADGKDTLLRVER